MARRRVIAALDTAESAGARLVRDGRSTNSHEGNFVGPSVVTDVTEDMDVYQQEVFGPVLVHVRVDGLDKGLALIARNPYGNGASIFTASGAAGRRFQREVTAGMVGVNVPIPVPVGAHGFGGWKASSFGDHNMYGLEDFRFYTRAKVVTSRWHDTDEVGGVRLAFPAGR